jgi:hydroxymethylglutaryl-CoA synthase
MKHVGIEALAIAVPRRYLALEDLARARGVDPAKFTHGLGAREMAVVDPGEDSVALAATAAARLIRAYKIDVRRIGMLVVGTETGVDHAKAAASHVQGCLKLPRTMRTFDTQHACYGGTAGLMAGAEWIASGAGAGRAALVICSDIARYDMESPGEPTQGAGAIAMLLSEEPHLLALDLDLNGVCSTDVHDFWRPLGRREALVDGHYSIQCYLDALSGAWRGWRERALARELIRWGDGLPSEQLARILYHVPFCKMARKAHIQLRRCDIEDKKKAPMTKEEEEQEAPHTSASFEAQVAPSLSLSSLIGNIYTGSLYLGFAGLLNAESTKVNGKRIGMFSYGSGCCGEFFSGTIGSQAAQILRAAGIDEMLANRERIDVAQYEKLMRSPSPEAVPPSQLPSGTFRFVGVKENKRIYAGNLV